MKLNARSLFVFVALTVGLPFSGHAQEAEKLQAVRLRPARRTKHAGQAGPRLITVQSARTLRGAKSQQNRSGDSRRAHHRTARQDLWLGDFQSRKPRSCRALHDGRSGGGGQADDRNTPPLFDSAASASAPGSAGLGSSRLAENSRGEAAERNNSGMRSNAFFRGRCFADAE